MAGKRRKIVVVSLLLAVSGCSIEGSGREARVEGLLRSPAQFVTSFGRCIFSLTFDKYQLTLPVVGKGINPPRLITVAGGGSLPVTADVRGNFLANSSATAKIQVTIDGRAETRSIVSSENGFDLSFQGQLSRSGETNIELMSSIIPAGSAQEEALLQIETLDIAVNSGSRSCDGS